MEKRQAIIEAERERRRRSRSLKWRVWRTEPGKRPQAVRWGLSEELAKIYAGQMRDRMPDEEVALEVDYVHAVWMGPSWEVVKKEQREGEQKLQAALKALRESRR